jgi:hypothetical protein
LAFGGTINLEYIIPFYIAFWSCKVNFASHWNSRKMAGGGSEERDQGTGKYLSRLCADGKKPTVGGMIDTDKEISVACRVKC